MTTTFPIPQRDLDDPDWRRYAECLSTDPELFFPIGETGPAALQIEEAKLVCYRCDVRARCLDYALDTRQEFGVWGAASGKDRRRILRQRANGRALARQGIAS